MGVQIKTSNGFRGSAFHPEEVNALNGACTNMQVKVYSPTMNYDI